METGLCCIYSSFRGVPCHTLQGGISSRVDCVINPQAVKRQAWLEFTLEPSLSHRHNLALCVCVSATTLLIRPQRYLRENVIMQILAPSSGHFIQPDACMCLWCFLFSLSLTCLGVFFGGGLGSCRIEHEMLLEIFFFFFYSLRVYFYENNCRTHTIL